MTGFRQRICTVTGVTPGLEAKRQLMTDATSETEAGQFTETGQTAWTVQVQELLL